MPSDLGQDFLHEQWTPIRRSPRGCSFAGYHLPLLRRRPSRVVHQVWVRATPRASGKPFSRMRSTTRPPLGPLSRGNYRFQRSGPRTRTSLRCPSSAVSDGAYLDHSFGTPEGVLARQITRKAAAVPTPKRKRERASTRARAQHKASVIMASKDDYMFVSVAVCRMAFPACAA